MSRCFVLAACLVWGLAMTPRVLGFVLYASVASGCRSSSLSAKSDRFCSNGVIIRGRKHVAATTSRRRSSPLLGRMMMSDDFAEDEMSFGAKAMQERTNAELQGMVDSHNIIAFIKGNRLMPQCGYSGTLVNILQSLSVPFETVDVLADERIRQGIKDFSSWPTIPQLYLGGEFVGGADIVIELFQSGELQEMIEVAAAS
ncbi:unnamed protein product [Laminaria digitata]